MMFRPDICGLVTDGYPKHIGHSIEMVVMNVGQTLMKENRKNEKKSLGLIKKCLNFIIFPKVLSTSSSKKASDILKHVIKVYPK